MTMPPEIIALVIAVIGGIIGMASALGAFRTGRTGVQRDVIDAYEMRVQQLESDVVQLKEQQKSMQEDLDKKEKMLASLTAILQNRNPEFESFMTTSLKLLNDIHSKIFFAA